MRQPIRSRKERSKPLNKSNMIPSNRLPIEPLMEEVKITGTSEFARFLGVSRWSILRMKKNGITGWQADEYAVKKAGTHPYIVWGIAFEHPDLWLDETREMREAA